MAVGYIDARVIALCESQSKHKTANTGLPWKVELPVTNAKDWLRMNKTEGTDLADSSRYLIAGESIIISKQSRRCAESNGGCQGRRGGEGKGLLPCGPGAKAPPVTGVESMSYRRLGA